MLRIEKKIKSQWGEVIVDKSHPLAECPNGFRISRHLQEIIAYLGSDYIFEEGSELLKKLLDVDLSAKQIQKVSEHMGSKLEVEAVVEQTEKDKTTQLEASQQVYTYVQMDGSIMLLTREENRTADAVERNKARTPIPNSY